MSKEYATLKIPKELADNIDRFIEENPELGYKSRAEFTKEAIRRHINELSK